MREGDPRPSKRSRPPASRLPQKPASPPKPAVRPAQKPAALKPTATSKLGSQRLPVTNMPAVLRATTPAAPDAASPAAPLISRTATLDDPFTTSLLAEVARRSRTLDVSPEQIAEAMDIDPDDGDPDPDDSR